MDLKSFLRPFCKVAFTIAVYILVGGLPVEAKQCEEQFLKFNSEAYLAWIKNQDVRKLKEGQIIDAKSYIPELNGLFSGFVKKLSDQELYLVLDRQFDTWMEEDGYIPGHQPGESSSNLDEFIFRSLQAGKLGKEGPYYDLFSQYVSNYRLFDENIPQFVHEKPLTPRLIDYLNEARKNLQITLLLEELKRRLRDGTWTLFQDDVTRDYYSSLEIPKLGTHPILSEDLFY